MTEIVLCVVALGVAAAAAFVIEHILFRFRYYNEEAIKYRASFFAAAEILVNEDETPEMFVTALTKMSRTITSPMVGRVLLCKAITGRLSAELASHPNDPDYLQYRKQVGEMRDVLKNQLFVALASYAMAITYNNFFLGFILRRVVFFWMMGNAAKLREGVVSEMGREIIDLSALHRAAARA